MQNNKENWQNERPINSALHNVIVCSELQRGENKTKKLVPFRRHLVDLGSHSGAHWILKGPQQWPISKKINIKWQKLFPRRGVKTKLLFDWFLMPKCWNCKNKVFALYLLQFTRFSRSRNLMENRTPKGIPHRSKLKTLGLLGQILKILGRFRQIRNFDEFWSQQKSITFETYANLRLEGHPPYF